MIKSNVTLSQVIAQFDRSPTNPVAEEYRSQRAEILKRFPRDKWPEMRLDDYAAGPASGGRHLLPLAGVQVSPDGQHSRWIRPQADHLQTEGPRGVVLSKGVFE